MTIEEILQGVRLRKELPGDLAESVRGGIGVRFAARAAGISVFCVSRSARRWPRVCAAGHRQGAVAVVSELPAPEGFPGRWIEVEHGRQALALAARNFYGKPD